MINNYPASSYMSSGLGVDSSEGASAGMGVNSNKSSESNGSISSTPVNESIMPMMSVGDSISDPPASSSIPRAVEGSPSVPAPSYNNVTPEGGIAP